MKPADSRFPKKHTVRYPFFSSSPKKESTNMKVPSPLKRKLSASLPQFLSFALPFLIVGAVFALAGVYPFGNGQIMASDGWHQYYPFLLTLREKLRTGGSLEYLRSIGMGTNYAPLYAYYLASPLNFLCVLWPEKFMVEFFTLMTMAKIAFAGYFFTFFLRTAYRKNEMSMAFFSLMYALCSWVGGYYWNIMWLDAFAVLPLLLAGMIRLLRDGRFRLYIFALALCLWSNYYVAFICCIFVLLCFFGYCICTWQGGRNFLQRFLSMAVCTLLGAGLTAVLLVPTLTAMQYTGSAEGTQFNLLAMNLPKQFDGDLGDLGFGGTLTEKVLPSLIPAFRRLFSRFLTGYEPAAMTGLPNVFCGFTAVILSVFFFCNKRISLREKLVSLGLLLFLVLSLIFRALDYVWHGFHFPNSIPYRFSFLVPFVLICMAYRSFCLMEDFTYRKLAVILPVSLCFLVSGYLLETMRLRVLVPTVAVLLGVIAFFCIHGKATSRKRVLCARLLLFAVILCEMTLSFALGVKKVDTSHRPSYPLNGQEVQELLDYVEETDTDPYYRIECSYPQTLNDGALNGYYGLSSFNSGANVNFLRFSRVFGFASDSENNRSDYYETSPFGNTLAGLKYLIDRDGTHRSSYNSLVTAVGNCNLLQNNSYLSLGFMANRELASYVSPTENHNALIEQEILFHLATDLEEDLYKHLSPAELTTEEDCSLTGSEQAYGFAFTKPESKTTAQFSVDYRVEEAGLLLSYLQMPGSDSVTVTRNEENLITCASKVGVLLNLGDVEAGDLIRFTFTGRRVHEGILTLDVALQNSPVYDLGMETLADETWVLTEASDTSLCGTVEAQEDGLFYSAIPYDPGWRAYVDGEEVPLAQTYDPSREAVLLTDALISFPLPEGTHTVELSYRSPGLPAGLLLTLLSATTLTILYLLRKRKTKSTDNESQVDS